MTHFDTQTKTQVMNFLATAEIPQLHDMKLFFDDLYYNAETHIEDWRYDMLKDALIERDSEYAVPVGAKLRDIEVEIALPYWLGSMDKIKKGEKEKLEKWKLKYSETDFILMDKLDGISCLLVTDSKGKVSLYTRGDGNVGKDITHISKYVNYIPSDLPGDLHVRGELVMSKNNFDSMEGKKVNMRNTVSGLVKAKTAKKALQDVDFVAYETIHDGNMEKLTEQFDRLIDMDFRVVQYEVLSIMGMDELERELLIRKDKSFYDIDGIIIQTNIRYERNVSKNPKYAFAYKSDIFSETTVLDVEWNISMSGMLKPRVKVEPLFLAGATISYATGYNASFIKENNIGPGAVVEIIRSGDVIPKITEVLVPCPEGAKMPHIKYRWGDTEVDIFAENPGDEIKVKILMHFMKSMKIKHVSEQTIRKMVEVNMNNIVKVLDANKEDFSELPGFKEKMIERTYNNIHDGMQDIDIGTLMAASNMFGFGIGEKRMKLLMVDYPNLYKNYEEYDDDTLLNMIKKIDGFSSIMTHKIIEGLPKFKIFWNSVKRHITLKTTITIINTINSLQGQKIVCSGFRDILDNEIENRGGQLVGSVSKNTSMVIVKDKNVGMSSKIEKAKSLGIPIYTIKEFRETVINS
jgi:DNA ligase (NAD+)